MKLCLWLLSSLSFLVGTANASGPELDYSFKPLLVDETFAALEVLPSATLLECAAVCRATANCTVTYFNPVDETCSIIKRDSVTWDNPTKTIFVKTGSESREKTIAVCFFSLTFGYYNVINKLENINIMKLFNFCQKTRIELMG